MHVPHVIREALDTVRECGFEVLEVMPGGKHYKAKAVKGGRCYTLTLLRAASFSHPRTRRNWISQLRRLGATQ